MAPGDRFQFKSKAREIFKEEIGNVEYCPGSPPQVVLEGFGVTKKCEK